VVLLFPDDFALCPVDEKTQAAKLVWTAIIRMAQLHHHDSWNKQLQAQIVLGDFIEKTKRKTTDSGRERLHRQDQGKTTAHNLKTRGEAKTQITPSLNGKTGPGTHAHRIQAALRAIKAIRSTTKPNQTKTQTQTQIQTKTKAKLQPKLSQADTTSQDKAVASAPHSTLKEATTSTHSCASTEQAANKGQEQPGSQAKLRAAIMSTYQRRNEGSPRASHILSGQFIFQRPWWACERCGGTAPQPGD
jgi:hypothetical protein